MLGSILGLSGGLSGGTSSSKTNTSGSTTATGATNNTYAPWQTGLQGTLGSTLSGLLSSLSSGTESPNVKAMQSQSDNAINQNYSAAGTNLNKSLAARGFGESGTTGTAALSTELGRQSALAGNQSNFAGLQLGQNQSFLSDALQAAFNSMGQTSSGSTTNQQTTNTSGSGFGAGLGASSSGKF